MVSSKLEEVDVINKFFERIHFPTTPCRIENTHRLVHSPPDVILDSTNNIQDALREVVIKPAIRKLPSQDLVNERKIRGELA